MGVGKWRVDDMVIHQVADTMGKLLDNDGGRTGEETSRYAEYQHKTTVGHVRRTPIIEAVNPSVELVLKLHFVSISAAKIGKSNARNEKK